MALIPSMQAHPNDSDTIPSRTKEKKTWVNRLHVGGYGEVAYTRNFYSDSYLRYVTPGNYADAPSHGRFDIPHALSLIHI